MRKSYLCRSIACLTAILPGYAVFVLPSMVLAGAGQLDRGECDPSENALSARQADGIFQACANESVFDAVNYYIVGHNRGRACVRPGRGVS